MKSSQVLPALQFSMTLPTYLSYFKELYKLSQQKNKTKKKTLAKKPKLLLKLRSNGYFHIVKYIRNRLWKKI